MINKNKMCNIFLENELRDTVYVARWLDILGKGRIFERLIGHMYSSRRKVKAIKYFNQNELLFIFEDQTEYIITLDYQHSFIYDDQQQSVHSLHDNDVVFVLSSVEDGSNERDIVCLCQHIKIRKNQ